jgi:hypothetical protein
MRNKVMIISLVITVGVLLLTLIGYLPHRYQQTASDENGHYIPEASTVESYMFRKGLDLEHIEADRCDSAVDRDYFDAWESACESDAAAKKNLTYRYCLSIATTSRIQYSYQRTKPVDRPRPEDCEVFKNYNVFKSNCILPEEVGRPITLKWKEGRARCGAPTS